MRRRNVLIAGDLGRVLLGWARCRRRVARLPRLPQLYLVALGAGRAHRVLRRGLPELPAAPGRRRPPGRRQREAAASQVGVWWPGRASAASWCRRSPRRRGAGGAAASCVGRCASGDPGRRAAAGAPPDRSCAGRSARGWRFVLGHPLLRAISGCTSTFNFFTPSAAHADRAAGRDLALPAGTIGCGSASCSVGAIVGALDRRPGGRLARPGADDLAVRARVRAAHAGGCRSPSAAGLLWAVGA